MDKRFAPWAMAGFAALTLILATGLVIGKPEAANVVGPRAEKAQGGCVHCHANEVAAWEQTTHHKSPEKLTTKEGGEIFAKLKAAGKADGAASAQQSQLCNQCHVTPSATGSTLSVSCESCHGGAREWATLHCTVKDFGDLQDSEAVRKAETAEQSAARFAACEVKGMIRPANLYALATNCLECHVVPHPDLVAAGHPAHSDTFELLAWSQGEVRHNFLRKQSNAAPTPARRRALYVVGQLADLERGLRGLALATEGDAYFDAMKARTWNARKSIKDIKDLAPDPRWDKLIDVLGKKRKMKPGMAKLMGERADQVRDLAQGLAKDIGSGTLDLTQIDKVLPTDAKGKVFEPN